MIGGKKFEKTIADAGFFFVDDSVAGGVDEDIRIDEAVSGTVLQSSLRA